MMDEGLYKSLTIINSILIAALPLVFFRKQKLQEIKYKELMELNKKIHDITTKSDKILIEKHVFYIGDYDRLDYLISRFRKHSVKLSEEVKKYKELWDAAVEKSKKREPSNREYKATEKIILNKSKKIRQMADDLLRH